jgi:mannose-1-phosphate guanylyltransferase
MRIVILAGGRGTRLKPITDKIPKVLVPVFGAPFLKMLLTSLKPIKADSIFLLTGYKSGMISDFCNKNKEFKNVRIIREQSPLGTGGALAYFATDKTPLLVMNGDTYADIPFNKLLAFHKKRKADVTILSYFGERASRGAILYDRMGKVKAFGEKTSTSEGAFSTGVYILEPKALKWLVNQLPFAFSMERDGFPLLIKGKKVYTYISSGKFFDIGTHEALTNLRGRDCV